MTLDHCIPVEWCLWAYDGGMQSIKQTRYTVVHYAIIGNCIRFLLGQRFPVSALWQVVGHLRLNIIRGWVRTIQMLFPLRSVCASLLFFLPCGVVSLWSGQVKVTRQKTREENGILFRDVFKHHIYANWVRNIKGIQAVVTGTHWRSRQNPIVYQWIHDHFSLPPIYVSQCTCRSILPTVGVVSKNGAAGQEQQT